jgi:O-antigen/teichoic acid export membrane protein
MSYTRLVIRSTILFIVLTAVGTAALYCWRLMLANVLTPTDVGLFFAVFGFISLVGGIREFGTTSATVKYVAQYRAQHRWKEMREMVWWMFAWQGVIFLVSVIGVLLFSRWLVTSYFKDPRSFTLMLWLLLLAFFTLLESFFFTIFQGFKAIKQYSMMGFMRGVFVLVVTAALLYLGWSVQAPAAGYAIALGLVMVFCAWWLWRLHPQFFTEWPQLHWSRFRKLAAFAIPVLIGLGGSLAFSYVDTIALTYFRTLAEVGLYSIAYSLVMLLRQLPKALSVIVFPVSTELFTLRDARLAEGVRKLLKYLMVITLPLGLGLIAYGNVALNILFPSSYAGALDILRLMSIAFVMYAIVTVNLSVLLGLGKPKAYSLVMVLGAVVNVAFDVLLAPAYGLWGIGVANILCQIVMLTVSAWSLHSTLKHTTPWRAWLKTAIAGALFVVVVQVTKGLVANVYMQVALSGVAACVVYGAAVLLFKVVDLKEVLHIVRVTLNRAPSQSQKAVP